MTKEIEEIRKRISLAIKEGREHKKINQSELAKKLKVSRNIISEWERGLKQPSSDKLVMLMKILGIRANKVFFEEKKEVDLEKEIDSIKRTFVRMGVNLVSL